jgi:AcrR family transcriptional regulator
MPRAPVNRLRARRAGAPATRWKIADAAVELFCTHGYDATTLQQIADAAGVHVQTIYLVFGSKIAVLAAALDVVRAGGEDPDVSPDEWPWAKALVADRDPKAQLRRYAAHVRNIAPRAGPLVAEVRNAARSNRELAAFLEQVETGRYLGPAGIVALIAQKGVLRRDLTPERAADTMFGVSSYESYQLLVADRHWTADEYERWLADVLCDLLLEVPAKPASRARRRTAPGKSRRGTV